ncbi:MAG: hypothetical protein QMC77_04750 [Methanocellales archaeon]|nr:hypothetical protein [Methanocellales archaeon]
MMIEDILTLYYTGAAVIILFFTLYAFMRFSRTDKNVLRARIFLNEDILNKTWAYGSVAGTSLAIHELSSSIVSEIPYVCETAKVVFLTAMVMMIYQWYGFGRGL